MPLHVGIVEVNPVISEAGKSTTLTVSGYNTFFTKAENKIRVWLKVDSTNALLANTVLVENDVTLQATFLLPTTLPQNKITDCTLIVDDPINGSALKPSAVSIKPTSQLDTTTTLNSWKQQPINNLHRKSSFTFPYRNILSETIRNTFYHVPLWFAMVILFSVSLVYSWRYLQSRNNDYDLKAVAFTQVGILFGILGLVTGAIWAKNTWGAYWSWDIKQNVSAIAMLIYIAYFVLRQSFEDNEKRARLSAVYNIFAYFAMIPLLFVIPRLADSLHPGNGGNPGFGGQDLDNTMRMVFYPAIIGWIIFGIWLAQLSYRIYFLDRKLNEF